MSNNNEPNEYIRAKPADVNHKYFFVSLDHAIVSNIEFIKQSVLYFLNENENIYSIDSILKKTKNIVTSIQKLYILTVTYKNFYNVTKYNNSDVTKDNNSDVTDLFFKKLFLKIIILLKNINNFWERIKLNDLKSEINDLTSKKKKLKNHIGKKKIDFNFRSATYELDQYEMFKVTADGPPFNIIEAIFKMVIIPMYYGITSLKCIPSTTYGIGRTFVNVVKRNKIKSEISNIKNKINKLETHPYIETDNRDIETDNIDIETDNRDIATCISDIETEIKKNIKNDIYEMNKDINKINFMNPTLQNFKDRYNDFMNYIYDIYKLKPFDQDELNQYNGFSIIYVEYEKYHDDTDIISTTEEDLQKLKRDELVIMYKGIFSLPDAITKVPKIIEKIIYPRDSGGAKNKKRTTIKSGHTLLRKTKHTNRNKIYRNKIYRNTKRIRQTNTKRIRQTKTKRIRQTKKR